MNITPSTKRKISPNDKYIYKVIRKDNTPFQSVGFLFIQFKIKN